MNNEEEVELVYIDECIGVAIILSLLLEILKYTGNLNISWLWVFSPLWIFIGGYAQMFLYIFLKGLVQGIKDK